MLENSAANHALIPQGASEEHGFPEAAHPDLCGPGKKGDSELT